MASGAFVAYYRVSTDKQSLGQAAQRKAVLDYLNGGGWKLEAELTEVESGKRHENRPELQRALALCRKQKATLVIAKLDRLSRNVAFISSLMESGVPFVAVDMPHATPFELHIRAALAEEERRMISKRTREALAAAKARGVKLGCPRAAEASVKANAAQQAYAAARRQNLLPLIKEVQANGATTYVAMAKALTARGVKTPRGKGEWYPATVYNLLKKERIIEEEPANFAR
jgi:DNA invertase Pin-like site-specific DNA recombinase